MTETCDLGLASEEGRRGEESRWRWTMVSEVFTEGGERRGGVGLAGLRADNKTTRGISRPASGCRRDPPLKSHA